MLFKTAPKKFSFECPKCKAKSKVLKKCKVCRLWCCSECSTDIVCGDCFVKLNYQTLPEEYWNEKYSITA